MQASKPVGVIRMNITPTHTLRPKRRGERHSSAMLSCFLLVIGMKKVSLGSRSYYKSSIEAYEM